jgi:hypothetical protein
MKIQIPNPIIQNNLKIPKSFLSRIQHLESSKTASHSPIRSFLKINNRNLKNLSMKSRKTLEKTSVLPRSKENSYSTTSLSRKNKLENTSLNQLHPKTLKNSKDLNMILKTIPKYTARKIQDMKKGYKPNFDPLATSFLLLFGEMDENLGLQMRSLRLKISEVFTSYLSNSGKFINLLRTLPEVMKKTEFSRKVILECIKSLESVSRSQLSNNYKDLYDFIYLLINYLVRSKDKYQNNLNRSISQPYKGKIIEKNDDFGSFIDTSIFQTYEKLESTTEYKFENIEKPLTCSNRNTPLIIFFDCKPPASPESIPKDGHQRNLRIGETSNSSKLSFTRPASCKVKTKPENTSDTEKIIIRNHISNAKKKFWDEMRQVTFI